MSTTKTHPERSFSYRARAKDGEVVTGSMPGTTSADIAALLRADGLMPTVIRSAGSTLPDFDAE
jgi:type II secretory pathway component PulF